MYKDKTKEYDSDYSTESNIEAAKEAAKLYDFELYEDEFREMREEELEELERLQEKMDGWVDEMCNPYNN
jgi:diphthamide synthase (EF-2-diphthine--ammonia ligase)